jgi:hypothetical protein
MFCSGATQFSHEFLRYEQAEDTAHRSSNKPLGRLGARSVLEDVEEYVYIEYIDRRLGPENDAACRKVTLICEQRRAIEFPEAYIDPAASRGATLFGANRKKACPLPKLICWKIQSHPGGDCQVALLFGMGHKLFNQSAPDIPASERRIHIELEDLDVGEPATE